MIIIGIISRLDNHLYELIAFLTERLKSFILFLLKSMKLLRLILPFLSDCNTSFITSNISLVGAGSLHSLASWIMSFSSKYPLKSASS